MHRQAVRRFMDFQKQPISLSAADLLKVGTQLEQLYESFGDLVLKSSKIVLSSGGRVNMRNPLGGVFAQLYSAFLPPEWIKSS